MNDLGVWGEKLAQKYLIKKKYKIIECNYKNFIGEIDIIAQKNNCIVFVEVKSRQSLSFGRPSESVTNKKQQKIRNVATSFIKYKQLENQSVRFDVIEVIGKEINHIENAF